jgi:uncharacterized protein (DUF2141 family)
MSNSNEDFIQTAVDKDSMHRMIDSLPDGGFAVLVINDRCGDSGRLAYRIFGHAVNTEIYGLLEWVKLLLFKLT